MTESGGEQSGAASRPNNAAQSSDVPGHDVSSIPNVPWRRFCGSRLLLVATTFDRLIKQQPKPAQFRCQLLGTNVIMAVQPCLPGPRDIRGTIVHKQCGGRRDSQPRQAAAIRLRIGFADTELGR